MEEILKEIDKPYWWVMYIILPIIASLIAAYLKIHIDSFVTHVIDKSKNKKRIFDEISENNISIKKDTFWLIMLFSLILFQIALFRGTGIVELYSDLTPHLKIFQVLCIVSGLLIGLVFKRNLNESIDIRIFRVFGLTLFFSFIALFIVLRSNLELTSLIEYKCFPILILGTTIPVFFYETVFSPSEYKFKTASIFPATLITILLFISPLVWILVLLFSIIMGDFFNIINLDDGLNLSSIFYVSIIGNGFLFSYLITNTVYKNHANK